VAALVAIAPSFTQWKKDLAWLDGEIARLEGQKEEAGRNVMGLRCRLPTFVRTAPGTNANCHHVRYSAAIGGLADVTRSLRDRLAGQISKAREIAIGSDLLAICR
jgi:hypothetical protein